VRRLKKILVFALLSSCLFYAYHFFTHDFFGILNYKPSKFTEQMEKPFFYSIDNTLRYGNTISKESSILFKANFGDKSLKAAQVLVSPDNTKAAVISDHKLYVVYANPQKPSKFILEHSFNYDPKIPMGEFFYKYPLLQWSQNSTSLYIASDIKKEVGKQSFSHDAVLIHIDLENTPITLRPIIRDFAALKYFFIDDMTLCFNYAMPNGDVKWKCFFQEKSQFVKSYTSNNITLEDGTKIEGSSLASYLPIHMHKSRLESDINENFSFIHLTNTKISENTVYDKPTIGLVSKQYSEKPIIKIQGGHNIKGHVVYGIGGDDNIKLFPDTRYLFLDVSHDNFQGQLLIDGLKGQYKELPKKTKVYVDIPKNLPIKERIEWTK